MLINKDVFGKCIFVQNGDMQKIVIGSDHAGFELKEELIAHLRSLNFQVIDKGTYSKESTDYSDYSHAVSNALVGDIGELGILICGSGNGVAMAANKHKEIRCALCWNEETSVLARAHNNANIIALPARFITVEQAKKMVDIFLSTDFEGGRHQRRVQKINLL